MVTQGCFDDVKMWISGGKSSGVFSVPTAGFVRVLADEIGTVEEDGELSVAGVRVFVSGVHTDSAGAITHISYTKTRPVSGELL